MRTILFLHALLPNFRETTFKHVCSFPRYEPGNIYLFHHLKAPVTEALKSIPFDGIILNYCFLGHRTERVIDKFRSIYSFINASPATKIAICQDDYSSNETLDAWLDEMNVSIVYSPITRDLDALYPILSRKPGVEFREGLTGYVDNDLLSGIENLTLPLADRPIDIGTRVRAIGPHLGRHAPKKAIVSQRFCQAAEAEGFVTDCSTDPKDVLLGTNWLRFLGSCRATIGSRGGASMADPDGSIKAACQTYLEKHPSAPYDEVKAACFPDKRDTYRFDAISPRLFEAAATRTCQVLIKEDYLGLEPYEDYIPLEEDFSNLSQVFEMLRSSQTLMRLTESAHQKLIASKRFSYESFVRGILDSIPSRHPPSQETFRLINQHFRALRPFSAIDERLGSLTAQTIKHIAMRHQRNAPDVEHAVHRSAIAALIEADPFPRYPDRAIQFQSVYNWAAEHDCDLNQFFAALPTSPDASTNLQEWGFCECIFDGASPDPKQL